jgi:exodeoxyribonuclease-5
MSITPTDSQYKAICAIKDWYQNESKHKQVFRLFGYAGTGKSTVLRLILEDLGLDYFKKTDANRGGVVVATYTGKAALVLKRKGIPARTIHSLIYSPYEATEEEIRELEKTIQESVYNARNLHGFSKTQAESDIVVLREYLRKIKNPRFELNYGGDASFAQLIVLDEVSMVGEDMAKDLLSFKKPILVIGDPGQLKPIDGTAGAFTNDEPDIMLTEIHRQAADSPIIRLATMARNFEPIGFGDYGDTVRKLPMMDVTPELLRFGQVICGLNSSRLQLNNIIRNDAGFSGVLPVGPEEKIICLKNDKEHGLINGMFISLDKIVDENGNYFSAMVKDEFGKPISTNRLKIYKGHFQDHVQLDKTRNDRDWKIKKRLVEATFSYCTTCHKSQGSQWENVVVWDECFGYDTEDRAKWLYTAITRAESGLIIFS